VCVEGKIQTRKYNDANGVEKYATEIVASHVDFLGGDRNEQQQQSSQRSQNYPPMPPKQDRPQQQAKSDAQANPYDYGPPALGDDEIPF
jgi:single-strand DNA-binding protein